MIRNLVYLSLFISALLISACGVVVTPIWEAQPTEVAVLPTQELITRGGTTDEAPAAVPPVSAATATIELPTAISVPPTATLVPTEIPIVSEATATTEPAAAAPVAEDDPVAVLASLYDPAEGEALFTRTEPSNSYSCASCHRVDSVETQIGPGLLNISTRGATRVEGMGAASYIHQSIVDPGAYVVPGFPDFLMPRNWAQVYTEDQIYSIVAYLLTLNG